jgi:protein-disulfide isomerase
MHKFQWKWPTCNFTGSIGARNRLGCGNTECLESGRYTERVQEDLREGSKIRITGTPENIFLHNKTRQTVLKCGAYIFDELKIIIDKILK